MSYLGLLPGLQNVFKAFEENPGRDTEHPNAEHAHCYAYDVAHPVEVNQRPLSPKRNKAKIQRTWHRVVAFVNEFVAFLPAAPQCCLTELHSPMANMR